MKSKILFAFATVLIAGTVFTNAADIAVSSGRTQLAPNAAVSGDTYTVTNGQLFFDAWNVGKTAASNVVLNGPGFANGSEPRVALRLNEGTNLTGTLTIGASTSIWSSGTAPTNTISGNIELAGGAAGSILDIRHSVDYTSTKLTLTGESIELPTLNIDRNASVEFSSANISFESITGDGLVTFAVGSKINLGFNDVLSIDAATLKFGDLVIDAETDLDLIEGYFEGAGIAGMNYADGVLSITAIPEPSTFGLLAGLGALALVVSRRRRSRKVA